MTYEVTPVRAQHIDPMHVEECSTEDAEMFGVYFRGEDGLAQWVADFVNHDDAIGFKAMKEGEHPVVWVATYDHKHGINVCVFETEAGAKEWRDEVAREDWREWCEGEPPEEGAGDLYFEACQGYEWFGIECRTVEP